jgi:hypothetical protein
MSFILKVIFFIVVAVLLISCKSIDSQSDKDFWDSAGELHNKMLVSKQEAHETIIRTEKLYKKLDNDYVAGTFIFSAKLDYLLFYGTLNEVKEHIEKNISNIGSEHSQYSSYLYRLALIYIELEEYEKFNVTISKIDNKMLLALASLNRTPNKINFDVVKDLCNKDCGYFPFYQHSISRYFAINNQYTELELFIGSIFKQHYILKDNYKDVIGRELLSYAAIAAKCLNLPSDVHKKIYQESISDIDYLSGLYLRVNNILKVECVKS